ncbi:MAG: adenosylcobinamide-phosphate synthase CbiB [Chlorobiales bacterium]|nr:adenosylcobinamide-phosphate synthase CbiB [Chlorobiales bacterium]
MAFMDEFILPLAFTLDLSFGDPRWMFHPVKAIGWLAHRAETWLRTTNLPLRFAGVLAVIIVVGGSAFSAWMLITLLSHLHRVAGLALSIYLLYSSFAVRDLGDHAGAVQEALEAGDRELAREKVALMVGRDTALLDEYGIALAATESIAENCVDGVTAPLFYGLLFGPVGAIAYKAINTLDSMFGYKNERYLEFGWAAAKLDDVANYLPARLSVLPIAVAALIGKLKFFDTFRAVFRGARLHASPNSGYPESAFAGALGVTLGGERSYGGVVSQAPLLGVKPVQCTPLIIRQSIALMWMTAVLFLGAGVAIRFLL